MRAYSKLNKMSVHFEFAVGCDMHERDILTLFLLKNAWYLSWGRIFLVKIFKNSRLMFVKATGGGGGGGPRSILRF